MRSSGHQHHSQQMLQSPVFSITDTHYQLQGVIKRVWPYLCTADKTQNLRLSWWMKYFPRWTTVEFMTVSPIPDLRPRLNWKKHFSTHDVMVSTWSKNHYLHLAQTHLQDQVADLFYLIFRQIIYWHIAYSSHLHWSTWRILIQTAVFQKTIVSVPVSKALDN